MGTSHQIIHRDRHWENLTCNSYTNMKKHYPKDPKKEKLLQELKMLEVKIKTRKKNGFKWFKGFKWGKKSCPFFCNADQTEPTDREGGNEEEVSLEEILLFWEELNRSKKKPAEP